MNTNTERCLFANLTEIKKSIEKINQRIDCHRHITIPEPIPCRTVLIDGNPNNPHDVLHTIERRNLEIEELQRKNRNQSDHIIELTKTNHEKDATIADLNDKVENLKSKMRDKYFGRCSVKRYENLLELEKQHQPLCLEINELRCKMEIQVSHIIEQQQKITELEEMIEILKYCTNKKEDCSDVVLGRAHFEELKKTHRKYYALLNAIENYKED